MSAIAPRHGRASLILTARRCSRESSGARGRKSAAPTQARIVSSGAKAEGRFADRSDFICIVKDK